MGALSSKFAGAEENNSEGNKPRRVQYSNEEVTRFRKESLIKVAGPPPPTSKPKCFDEHACQIEDIEVAALKKLKELDEANSKKLDISADSFDVYWYSIRENSKVLETLDVPTFMEEKAKVAEAFKGGTLEEKEEAIANYQEAVTEQLNRIKMKVMKKAAEEKKEAEAKK